MLLKIGGGGVRGRRPRRPGRCWGRIVEEGSGLQTEPGRG